MNQYAAVMTDLEPPLWRAIISRLNPQPTSESLDSVHTALNGAVGRGTLQRIRDGVPGTALKTINAIAKKLGCDSSELLAHPMSHQGANVLPSTRELSMREREGPAEGYVRLPILAEAAAGAGRVADETELIEHVDVAETWVRRTLRANPANLRVLTARGHSMAGVIEDGDAMFVTPVTEFQDDGVYVIAVGGLLRVKRLRLRVLDQMLSIESTDGSSPETIPLSQADDALRICGKVVGAWALRKL